MNSNDNNKEQENKWITMGSTVSLSYVILDSRNNGEDI